MKHRVFFLYLICQITLQQKKSIINIVSTFTEKKYIYIWCKQIWCMTRKWQMTCSAFLTWFSLRCWSLSANTVTPEPHEESFMSVGLQFPVETFREKATFGEEGFIKTWDWSVKFTPLFIWWSERRLFSRQRYTEGAVFKFLSAISSCKPTYLNLCSFALITLTSLFTEQNNEECFPLLFPSLRRLSGTKAWQLADYRSERQIPLSNHFPTFPH